MIILGFKLYQSQLVFTVLCVHLNISKFQANVFSLATTVSFSLQIKLGESHALVNCTFVLKFST